MNIRNQVQNQRIKRKLYLKQSNWNNTIKHRARHLKIGTIIETCGCDIARVTFIDPDSDDCDYVSLTSGGRGSCSIYNCAPTPLTPSGIKIRMEIFHKEGRDGLSLRYYMVDCRMSKEDAQALINQWKNPVKEEQEEEEEA